MNMPQDVNFSAPRIFLFITRAEDEKKLDGILDWLNVPICYQCRGQGTAPSELLDIFGLGGTTRVLTAGILPKFVIKVLLKKLTNSFLSARKEKGSPLRFRSPDYRGHYSSCSRMKWDFPSR